MKKMTNKVKWEGFCSSWISIGSVATVDANRRISAAGAAATLNEQLTALGYVTSNRDAIKGGKNILRDGRKVFEGTAGDVWSWLRETGQIGAAS